LRVHALDCVVLAFATRSCPRFLARSPFGARARATATLGSGAGGQSRFRVIASALAADRESFRHLDGRRVSVSLALAHLSVLEHGLDLDARGAHRTAFWAARCSAFAAFAEQPALAPPCGWVEPPRLTNRLAAFLNPRSRACSTLRRPMLAGLASVLTPLRATT